MLGEGFHAAIARPPHCDAGNGRPASVVRLRAPILIPCSMALSMEARAVRILRGDVDEL